MTITVKCVFCGEKKKLDKIPDEMPMCEKDFGPMLAESADTQ